MKIDISDMIPGEYMIEIKTNKNKTYQKFILKKN